MTIATTGTQRQPATDLGFLLHKHPDKAQRFSTAHGTAHVFYPEAEPTSCTAAMLLEVDPIALVRRGKGRRQTSTDSSLEQYVNDRPYAASSLFAVALAKVFGSALNGQCKYQPELPSRVLPLRIEVPALPASGGCEMVRRFFEPLGWTVWASPVPVDQHFPEWGDSRYVHLVLRGETRLSDALRQLYVLLPVLDGAKHYWVSDDEVEKLLRAGSGWLESHPEQEVITGRYLARRGRLARRAMEHLELARLAESDDSQVEAIDNAVADPVLDSTITETTGVAIAGSDTTQAAGASTTPLAVARREAIAAALCHSGAASVLDLGCGQGQLISLLLKERQFTRVTGVDVAMRALHVAARRLRLDELGEWQSSRITLLQSSLTYTDRRLRGYDAAVLSEVIEHVDEPRLPTLEFAVFGFARPGTVIVTTPNVEYNVRWESLPVGRTRHADHRFEWDRTRFRDWAEEVGARYGYAAELRPVGPDDPEVGPPTQLALFTLLQEDVPSSQKGGDAA